MLGAAAVLVTVWAQVAGLRSLDSQDSWRRLLDEPPLAGSGVTLGQVLDVVHVLAMVAGACAVAAVILGWHALQRSRPALIALTIVSVPLFLAGLTSSAVFPTVVLVAVVMLWLQPARDWYAGREQPPASTRPSAAPARPSSAPVVRPPAPAAGETSAPPPPPAGYQLLTTMPREARVRPGAVVAAAAITWVVAALGAILLVAATVDVAARPAQVWQQALSSYPELSQDGYTQSSLVVAVIVVAVLALLWLLAAAVMALLVWFRVGWARTVLVVLAVLSALVLMLCSLVDPVAVVPMIVAVFVAAVLMRPEVTRWLGSAHD